MPICLSYIKGAQTAANSKAVATLVVPEWPSAPYWPMLCPDGIHLAEFVHMWMHIPQSTDTTLPGKRGANIFKAGQPNTAVLALRLDFIQPPRKFKTGFCMSQEKVCQECTTKYIKWQELEDIVNNGIGEEVKS